MKIKFFPAPEKKPSKPYKKRVSTKQYKPRNKPATKICKVCKKEKPISEFRVIEKKSHPKEGRKIHTWIDNCCLLCPRKQNSNSLYSKMILVNLYLKLKNLCITNAKTILILEDFAKWVTDKE